MPPTTTESTPANAIPKAARKRRGIHRRTEEAFSFSEADDRIYDIFSNHGFADYPHQRRHQLVRFYQLLMHQQNQDNLTRLLRIRDVAIKHFIDCLMIPRLITLPFPLLDIGTGPGFPGIPLKVEYPDARIILAEGVQKRVEFLKSVRAELSLTHLDIVGRNITPDFALPVAGAITRAVEDISLTLHNVSQSLMTSGLVFFMKGPNCDAEIKKAQANWSEYFTLERDIAYDLPKTPHKRRLVVFRKIQEVPWATGTKDFR